jgi:hypothetical protein
MKSLEKLLINSWEEKISREKQDSAINALENGLVLFFPALPFELSLEEKQFLNPAIVNPKTKNISYDIRSDKLSGSLCSGKEEQHLKGMVKRYATTCRHFIEKLLPHYTSSLIQARTSFRPVEISGRKNPSYRKDDTLLHVDSFPSSPTRGQRILRIFTNVNPDNKPRVWRVGEPFSDVVRKIHPKVSRPIPGMARLLQLLQITKAYRTPYDHYMLQIHDTMKGDAAYQRTVPQEEIHFPAGSSWMVYTDQVSHAALAGQHVFEQTFHLPVEAIKHQQTNPLRVLEKYLEKALI